MTSRRTLVAQLVLIVVIALAAVIIPVATTSSPTLGLDLQGGFSVVLQAREIDGQAPSEESVEKAKDIIAQRVDGLGVAEPDIVRQGRTVIVQLPGVTDREQAEQVVGCTAKLEFRPVLGSVANPDQVDQLAPSTTAPAGDATTTTTTAPAGDTTTTAPAGDDATTTTAPAGDGEGEGSLGTFGTGSAGLAPGEGAMPSQFAPTTTTTAPPTTTTTAPPATTVPVEEPTTTVPVEGETTTTTTPVVGNDSTGCTAGIELSEEAIAAALPAPEGGVIAPSEDGAAIFTLGPVGFTGDALSSAEAVLQNEWAVSATVRGDRRAEANAAFNACFFAEATCPPQGADETGAARGSIAIVLDGQVLSAPTVNAQDLASDSFIITGQFDQDEARELALVLRYGSLPVEFEQVALQQVSATLGQDSLRSGMIAGAIGLVLVAAYMLLYYRALGFVVIAGLAVWASIMYGVVTWLSVSQSLALTLSGIIGMVISVGTSVDSYIVYFERLRDDVRGGRTMRNSSERGFKSAYRTITAAAITSFIGSFLLWWLTIGAVRGFAFFLGLSVLLSLVVTYFFTRPLVILLGRSRWFTNSRSIGVGGQAGAGAEGVVA